MAMSQRSWKREQERRRRERQRRARQRRNCMIVVFIAAAAVIFIVAKGCASKPSVQNDAPETTAVSTESVVSEPVQSAYRASITEEDLNKGFFENSAFCGNSVADTIGMYNILPETDFYTDINLDVNNVYNTAANYSTTAVSDQLKSKKFNKIFLSFGEKEIAAGNRNEFINSYKSFVEKIKSYQSGVQIYIIGITPVTREVSNDRSNGLTKEGINSYNKRIKSMAEDLGARYVDTSKLLGQDGGFLPQGVSADGINLNKECCIDLLGYISKKAAAPKNNSEDADSENESEEDADDDETGQQESNSDDPTPEPTVNVLKDNVRRE